MDCLKCFRNIGDPKNAVSPIEGLVLCKPCGYVTGQSLDLLRHYGYEVTRLPVMSSPDGAGSPSKSVSRTKPS